MSGPINENHFNKLLGKTLKVITVLTTNRHITKLPSFVGISSVAPRLDLSIIVRSSAEIVRKSPIYEG